MGWDLIRSIEKCQQEWMIEEIQEFPELRWLGMHHNRVALYSFVHETIHPSDLGSLLDQQGIAIRTGHHCTQPLWESLGLNGSARASLTVYNSEEEVGVFSKALRRSINMMV